MAMRLNSLQRELDDRIQPISASILVEGRQAFAVAVGFPVIVREFWKLVLDKPTLI